MFKRQIGPIPVGVWIIGKPVDGTHMGPHAIPLTPAPGTVTKGRSGFYMHGDNQAHNKGASEGCIIQVLLVRVKVTQSGAHLLQVFE